MKKYSKILKSLLSFVLMSTMTTFAFKTSVNAANANIVIDSGGASEYVVQPNSVGKVEAEIAAGFVQSNDKKTNISKVNINSYSTSVGSRVLNIVPTTGGNYLAVLYLSNYSSQVNNPSILHYETIYILKIDQNGNVLKHVNVATNLGGIGYPPDMDSSKASMQNNQYAAYRTSYDNLDGTLSLFYSGQSPLTTTSPVRTRAIIDSNLNVTYSIGNTGVHTPGHQIDYTSKDNTSSEFYSHGEMKPTSVNQSTLEFYNLTNGFTLGDKIELKNPGYGSLNSLPASNWLISTIAGTYTITPSKRVGVVSAWNTNYTPSEKVNAVIVWDGDGNIMHRYAAGMGKDLTFVPAISNIDTYYFIEDVEDFAYTPVKKVSILKSMNTSTGSITNHVELPFGTKIQILPNQAGTDEAYVFRGYTPSATGVFTGYATSGGAIYGTMKSDFSVNNANIIATNGTVNFYTFVKMGNTDRFVVGGGTTATDFTNTPPGGFDSHSPNSEKELYDSFFGILEQTDDYAPALKLAREITINKDTASDIQKDAMKGVEVYDVFDLDPNGSNITKDELFARVNKNVNDLSKPIDWKALGLDSSKIGYNKVTYFITDTSKNQTVSERSVNIIDNNTKDNSEAALRAKNFTIHISAASDLNEATAKNIAQVMSWNKLSGADLFASVKAESAQLKAIQNTKVVGPFSLTFYVVENGKTVENEIIVSVVDDDTVLDDIIALDANDFSVRLKNVGTVTEDNAKLLSQVTSWNLTNGDNLFGLVSADAKQLEEIQKATAPGQFPLTFNVIENGHTLSKEVIVTVTKGNEPVIIAPEKIEVEIGTIFDPLEGVTATDVEDGIITDLIIVNGTVNVDVIGPNIIEYSVTDSDGNTDTATTVVSVVDKDTEVSNTAALHASDFTVHLNDVSKVVEEYAMLNANVKAWNTSNGTDITNAVQVNAEQLKAIQDTKVVGPFALEFSVVENGVKLTNEITVSVVADTTELNKFAALDANDFTVHLNDVSKVIKEYAMLNANVKACNITDGTDITSAVQVNGEQLKAIQDTKVVGPFALEFSVVENGVKLTNKITVSVVADTTELNKFAALDANDFTVHLNDVAKVVKEYAVFNANVKAWNITDGTDITSAVQVNVEQLKAIQDTKVVGPFALEFSVVENGVKLTNEITVSVVADTTELNKFAVLDATDFTVHLNDVSKVIEEYAMLNANVKAWNITNGTDITNAVQVNAEQLKAIQDTKVVGPFALEFSVVENGVKLTNEITVSVVADTTKLNTIVALDASNFTVYLDEVDSLTELMSKSYAKVKSWNITNGNVITSVVKADAEQLKAIQDTKVIGAFLLKFSVTEDGQTVENTIIVSVINNNIDRLDDLLLDANDFSIRLSEASSLVEEMAKNKANVMSWNVSDGTNLTGIVKADSAELAGIVNTQVAGKFPLTFEVSDKGQTLQKTIYVTVVVGNAPVIDAPNITEIKLNEKIDLLLDVSATDIEDGDITSKIKVGGDEVNTSIAGVYLVEYTVVDSDGNSVDKKRVILVNDGTYVAGDEYIINANDFKVHVSKVNNEDKFFTDLSKVRVYDLKDNNWLANPSIMFDRTNLISKVGKYNVSFMHKSKITVVATVYDDGSLLTKTGSNSATLILIIVTLMVTCMFGIVIRKKINNM